MSGRAAATRRVSPVTKTIGRVVDFLPGITFVGGKPALCPCGRVNF
ncbi:hypothetical protein NRB56_03780 [Nocardia sp. RB56]|uniref:Uncharacterized protein n=1 Tax=Nocardia aurantia TaxID=2585199 RepID=A0A7K0DG90_9NOCA|nr:hypothetical protein [Nocardia aurantia]